MEIIIKEIMKCFASTILVILFVSIPIMGIAAGRYFNLGDGEYFVIAVLGIALEVATIAGIVAIWHK